MNCGLTRASSGKRRNTPAQNEWIVWIFNPPGVSIARANSVRACASWAASIARVNAQRPQSARASSSSGIIAHSPKPLEQAVLHLGGGGLGIGQAQDVLRRHLFQQQPRNAVGQHAGFA